MTDPRCTCPYGERSLGRLHGVSMGRGMVRLSTTPRCPEHDSCRGFTKSYRKSLPRWSNPWCPIHRNSPCPDIPTPTGQTLTIFDWQVDTPVDDIIGEAIGAASVCWENPGGAGVFDSERASAIVDEVMAALRQKLWVQEGESMPRGHAGPCEPGNWGGWG